MCVTPNHTLCVCVVYCYAIVETIIVMVLWSRDTLLRRFASRTLFLSLRRSLCLNYIEVALVTRRHKHNQIATLFVYFKTNQSPKTPANQMGFNSTFALLRFALLCSSYVFHMTAESIHNVHYSLVSSLCRRYHKRKTCIHIYRQELYIICITYLCAYHLSFCFACNLILYGAACVYACVAVFVWARVCGFPPLFVKCALFFISLFWTFFLFTTHAIIIRRNWMKNKVNLHSLSFAAQLFFSVTALIDCIKQFSTINLIRPILT